MIAPCRLNIHVVRRVAIVAIAALMVASVLFSAGISPTATSGAATPLSAAAPAASTPSPATPPTSSLPHNAGSTPPSSGRGTFWISSLVPPPSSPACLYFTCMNNTGTPAIAANAAGIIVTAETAFTNATACPSNPDWTWTEVGVSVSTDQGVTWGTPQYLANPGCQDAANFTSAMWPALVALSNDTFVLAYLEYNISASNNCQYGNYDYFPAISPCFVLADRLVVSESYDNGTTWTSPTTVDSVLNLNLSANASIPAQPALAAFGSTVYLGWTNFTNPYFEPFGGPGTSVGLWLSTSTNGGQSFGAAKALPVQAGTYQGFLTWVAYGPALAVNSTGALYLAYSTDFNYNIGPLCQATGCGNNYEGTEGTMSVVVATSTNQGSSFTVRTVATNVPAVWNGFDTWIAYGPGSIVSPAPAIAVSPTTGEVFVTYAGGAFGTFCYSAGSCSTGDDFFENVWVATSSTGGMSWTTPTAIGDSVLGIFGAAQEPEGLFTPSIAVAPDGTVYVNAAMNNESYCLGYNCDLWTDEMFVSTDNATTFPSSYDLTGAMATVDSYPLWDGFDTAMTILNGTPYAAWTWQDCPGGGTISCFAPSSTDLSQVVVSRLFTGPGVVVTFNETGLPLTSMWSANLGGNLRAGAAGTNLVVSGVPNATTLAWSVAPVGTGVYGLQYLANDTPASPGMFNSSSTVSAAFEEYALLNILTVPPPFPGYPFPCSLSPFFEFCANQNLTPGVGPNWVPVGATIDYGVTSSALPAYCYYCMNLTFLAWSGSGSGSWNTSVPNGTSAIYGPVNETASFALNNLCQGSTCFNLTYSYNFTEVGLPTNTSWEVTLAGQSSSTAQSWLLFNATYGPNPFTVWTVSYNSTYAWVGTPNYESPIAAPQGANVTVRFQLEPLASATFAVNFSEVGVPSTATGWGLQLGSSQYGISSVATGTTIPLAGGSPGTDLNATDVYGSVGVGGQLAYFNVTPFTYDATPYHLAPGGNLQLTGPADVVAVYAPLYWVDVPAPANGTVSAPSQWVASGQTLDLTATPSAGYSFVGWTGTGTGSKTTTAASISVSPGSPVTEVATFAPVLPTYNVTFSATGLAAGQPITVDLGGTTYTGAAPLTISGLAPGNYALSAPSIVPNGTVGEQFFATGITSSLPLAGGLLNVSADGTATVAYATQYLLTVNPTVNGTVSPAPGTYWEMSGASVSLVATPDNGYLVVGWVGTGTGSSTTSTGMTSVTMSGAITETASFTLYIPPPSPVYTLTLSPAGLPAGVSWSASIGSQALSGTGTLVFADLSGNVTVSVSTASPSAGVRYVPTNSSFVVDVTSNLTVDQPSFTTQYEVTVSASSGGVVTPSSGWVDAGAAISLTALPQTGYSFVNWTGTGTGAYSGTAANTSFTLSGPISEFANFQPTPSTGTSSNGGGSILVPILALVVLLVVGLVVGLVIARARRGRAPPAPVEPAPVEPGAAGGTAAPSGDSSVYSESTDTTEGGDEGGGEVVYGRPPQ